jgi:hypothetical protein
MGNHSNFSSWFFSKYSQLVGHEEVSLRGLEIDFLSYIFTQESCPLLHVTQLPLDFLKPKNSIINFLIDSVSSGYYVYFHVDEFYLRDRSSYQKSHFCHDILISGYNNIKEVFSISGYDKSHHFRNSEASYYEILYGFINVDYQSILEKFPEYPVEYIHLLKINNQLMEDSIDIKAFIMDIEDYLNGTNSTSSSNPFYKDGLSYGINIYNNFIKYLELLKNGVHLKLDIRPFHLLYEHKKIMRMRIEYFNVSGTNLKKRESLLDSFKFIEKTSLIIKNLFMKYLFNKENSELDRITLALNSMMEREKESLYKLLQNLQY